MGRKIEKQISDGVYPNKETLIEYYIHQNHSLEDTCKYFKLSKNVIVNLISYFNVHKDKISSVKLYSSAKINNHHYPSKDELLFWYSHFQNWEQVRSFFNIPDATFKRLRYRLGLKREKGNPILVSKESLQTFLKSYKRKPTGKEVAADLQVNPSMVYYWTEKFNLSHLFNKYGSSYEEVLRNFLNMYGFKKDRTVLHPYELDFFNSDLRIAIEFNGDYWHSDKFKDKFYHFNKSKRCEEQNIKLIHIYEYEFKKNQTKILKYLYNLLSQEDIYMANEYECVLSQPTRDYCEIQSISIKDSKILNTMSFQRLKDNYWQIIEYHVELNNRVQESNKKMFNMFLQTADPEVITYECDYNKDNGKELIDYGMIFDKFLSPEITHTQSNNTVYDAGVKILKYHKKKVIDNDKCVST